MILLKAASEDFEKGLKSRTLLLELVSYIIRYKF